MEIIIIAAISKNGVIGNKGKMPWHSKEELQFFRETTFGFPVVMGRKTFNSFNNPLVGRENIILSHNKNIKLEQNCVVCHSTIEAISYCKKRKIEKCFVIGGGEIFEQMILIADELIISEMNFEVSGDVFFPKINEQKWNKISSKSFKDFNVNYYKRVIRQQSD